MFYLFAALLLALAAGFVLLAFRRAGRAAVAAARPASEASMLRRRTVAVLFKDRLEELRQELSRGGVTEADQEALEAELGAALLADVPESEAERASAGESAGGASGREAAGTEPRLRPGAGLIGGSVAVLLGCALLVYWTVGDPAAPRLAGSAAILELDPEQDREALESWRLELSERVADRPDDGRSAYLLGRVDLRLGYFATAAEAFARAHRIVGDDPSIDVFWLQARYLSARGKMDATTREIADRVLAQNPNQPMVLELYAMDAFQRSDFAEAVSLLNRALSSPALADEHRAALASGYQQARGHLGDELPALDVAIASASAAPVGSTLFVIARPLGGGMPYAVVRRPAGVLPTTIRLDDAVSMNPALPLSSAPAVEVVVRLSRAGTPMAHPGDWEWRSGEVSLEGLAAPVQLSAELRPPEPQASG